VYAKKKNQIDSAYKHCLAVSKTALFNQENEVGGKILGLTAHASTTGQERKEVQQRYNTQLKCMELLVAWSLLLHCFFPISDPSTEKQENQLKTGFTKEQYGMRGF